jgi:Sec-independent protein translocase protein TatA
VLNFPSPEKILMLGILALVVLGPTRLPQAARTASKWMAELRKLTSRFKEEMAGTLADPKDAITAAVGDLRSEVGGWRNEMSGLTRSLTTRPTDPTSPAPAFNGGTSGVVNGGSGSGSYVPSGSFTDSGSSGSTLPVLPPAPDDPSLN